MNTEHHAFIVETFIKTNESVTATQQAFRLHFNLGRRDPQPAQSTILFWVTNFRATGSGLKRKSTSWARTARTTENEATIVNDFYSVWTIMETILLISFLKQWNRLASYVLFKHKNTFLFLYFICILLNLQMYQIILYDPV